LWEEKNTAFICANCRHAERVSEDSLIGSDYDPASLPASSQPHIVCFIWVENFIVHFDDEVRFPQ